MKKNLEDSVYDYDETDAFGKIKKRNPNQYRRTSSILFKIALFFGLVLLVISITLRSMIFTDQSSNLYSISVSSIPGSIFSISIILLAVSVIMYFFEYQFAKLDQIIEELENYDSCIVDEDKKEQI